MRSIPIVPFICLLVACGGKAPAPSAPATVEPGAQTRPEATQERTGVIGRNGQGQTLFGPDVDVGATAPPFRLVGSDGNPVDSADYRGKLVVLSVVPSIETPVCEAQTGRMAMAEPRLPPGAVLLTVSRDAPDVQKQFLTENDLRTHMASDTDGSFGDAYGLQVMETGRLARSVWVIDRDGTIAYRQLVANQATEPDYDALLAAVARIGNATQ